MYTKGPPEHDKAHGINFTSDLLPDIVFAFFFSYFRYEIESMVDE